ncbi:hypothetical protein HDU81_005555 [Chytriomyces hyalinus]|nr:hypothetical protein HDU81_005555 [Chytriomyces hyalinus]
MGNVTSQQEKGLHLETLLFYHQWLSEVSDRFGLGYGRSIPIYGQEALQARDRNEAVPLLTAAICALEERARVTERKRKFEIINAKLLLDKRWWKVTSGNKKKEQLEDLSHLRRELTREMEEINDLRRQAVMLLLNVQASLRAAAKPGFCNVNPIAPDQAQASVPATAELGGCEAKAPSIAPEPVVPGAELTHTTTASDSLAPQQSAPQPAACVPEAEVTEVSQKVEQMNSVYTGDIAKLNLRKERLQQSQAEAELLKDELRLKIQLEMAHLDMETLLQSTLAEFSKLPPAPKTTVANAAATTIIASITTSASTESAGSIPAPCSQVWM